MSNTVIFSSGRQYRDWRWFSSGEAEHGHNFTVYIVPNTAYVAVCDGWRVLSYHGSSVQAEAEACEWASLSGEARLYDTAHAQGGESHAIYRKNPNALHISHTMDTFAAQTPARKHGGNIKASDRRYVALTHQSVNPWNQKPEYWDVVCVSEKGASKQDTMEQAHGRLAELYAGTTIYYKPGVPLLNVLQNRLVVVSMSAAKRAYRGAYKAWLAECYDTAG